MKNNEVDIAIVGAGIIGSFLAHDLAAYQGKIIVFEKNADVANGSSMANSAIVHSGHDPKPGTLKAKLNVRGNEMYEEICKELKVSFERVSAYVVAAGEDEERTLDALYSQTVLRNVPVRYVPLEEAKLQEKNLSDHITKVIELPTTGIIYPWEVSIALMEEAVLNEVDLHLECEVLRIECLADGRYQITTTDGTYIANMVINAAGVYADQIYSMVSNGQELVDIHPRKGEYFVLDRQKEQLVNRVIYPVPSEKGKGVLAVPTIHGNILLGPNSDFVTDKEGVDATQEALSFIRRELDKTIKNVPMGNVIRTFAGLRPTGTTHDFVIEEASDAKNFINVACIESPGLASAPAISEYVIEEIIRKNQDLQKKPYFVRRRPPIHLSHLSKEEREEIVKKDPSFAKIVCRCEQISEGEILDAIRRPVPGRTVKGIKKRCRPGMGRCQGGFCEPLVVEILAREFGIPQEEVKFDTKESYLFIGETKQTDDEHK